MTHTPIETSECHTAARVQNLGVWCRVSEVACEKCCTAVRRMDEKSISLPTFRLLVRLKLATTYHGIGA
jgi:hypothetical protein